MAGHNVKLRGRKDAALHFELRNRRLAAITEPPGLSCGLLCISLVVGACFTASITHSRDVCDCFYPTSLGYFILIVNYGRNRLGELVLRLEAENDHNGKPGGCAVDRNVLVGWRVGSFWFSSGLFSLLLHCCSNSIRKSFLESVFIFTDKKKTANEQHATHTDTADIHWHVCVQRTCSRDGWQRRCQSFHISITFN